jgi:hypothetical protein
MMDTSKYCYKCSDKVKLNSNYKEGFRELGSKPNWNYGYLRQCETCNTLWVVIYYEPYSSFEHWVRWDKTQDDFFNEKEELIGTWHASWVRKWRNEKKPDEVIGACNWKDNNPPEYYLDA